MPKVDLRTWKEVENALARCAEKLQALNQWLEERDPGSVEVHAAFDGTAEMADRLAELAEEVRDYEQNQERLAEERASLGFTETNHGRLCDPDRGPRKQ